MEQTPRQPEKQAQASHFRVTAFLRRLCTKQYLYGLSLFSYLPENNTFPFTKYGVIDAVVDNVSSDATADEQRGLIYKARMLMKINTLWVDGREVNLVPGMSISAEVLTPLIRIV
ncbi:hypothetical protein [Amphritea japonica]|uniref:hypothetical protein n=1 Tax=Amphritea japonica TaxID=452627 RepID=UPI000367DA25|nr:hypothetical protein [Amphritea japonica]